MVYVYDTSLHLCVVHISIVEAYIYGAYMVQACIDIMVQAYSCGIYMVQVYVHISGVC